MREVWAFASDSFLKKIRIASLWSNETKINWTPSYSKKRMIDKYNIPSEYIRSVARGFNKSLIFLGGAGLGKSYLTRQILTEEGANFKEIRGVNSPLGFYNLLYENNKANFILVFDDVYGLVNEPRAYSLLLGVLWEGLASWNSTSEKLKIPNSFKFKGRIIFIANKLKGDNADIVKSRCLTYDLDLDLEDKIRMMYLIAELKHKELSKDKRILIVDFIKANTSKANRKLDLRTQQKIEQLYLYDSKNWENLARPLLKCDRTIEILEYCINKNPTTKEAEKEFIEETGLSRASFYRFKKSQ